MSTNDYNPFTLAGKTVLVTGASSGIGRETAITCSKMGARVVISGRDETRLSATLEALAPLPSGTGAHVAVPADLKDADALDALVAALPVLDGVVQNAGVNKRMPCAFVKEAAMRDILGTDLEAPMLLQKMLLKKRKIADGGSVVFTASLAAWRPTPGNAVYSAAKAGLIAYARTLAVELAPKKIRVNCVLPGMVWTEILNNTKIDLETYKENEKTYPLGRYGVPADIAPLVVYLLSDASAWMTGTQINIDGGAGL